jgi:hypothetical protein
MAIAVKHWDSKMLLYFYVQTLCGWTAEMLALGNVSKSLGNWIGKRELIKQAAIRLLWLPCSLLPGEGVETWKQGQQHRKWMPFCWSMVAPRVLMQKHFIVNRQESTLPCPPLVLPCTLPRVNGGPSEQVCRLAAAAAETSLEFSS